MAKSASEFSVTIISWEPVSLKLATNALVPAWIVLTAWAARLTAEVTLRPAIFWISGAGALPPVMPVW